MKTLTPLTEKIVLDALRQVIDPELGCNIVDLGLIYDIKIEGGKVAVKMTLTSAGCPMQESLASGVHAVLLGTDGVEDASVEVVFDPPWNPQMLSEEARGVLGIYES